MTKTSADVCFDIYEQVWHLAVGAGATVEYVDVSGGGGLFFPGERANGKHSPMIQIDGSHPGHARTPCRGDCKAPPAAPAPIDQRLERELLVLAHEFGHLRSWQGVTPRAVWERYNAIAIRRDKVWEATGGALSEEAARAIRAALTEADCSLIIQEEALAWDIAKDTLSMLGYTGWAAFDRAREVGLQAHRRILGIEPFDARGEEGSASR